MPSGRTARAPVDEPALPPARAAPPRPLDHPPPTPRPVHAIPQRVPAYMRPERSALRFNNASAASLAPLGEPRGATLHFTFGSAVMMDFVRNWLHFVRRARIGPVLVGAADLGLLQFCDAEGVPAAAIAPELDVWTYKRKPVRAGQGAYQIETEWKYFRHHNSDFLEMGLVKVSPAHLPAASQQSPAHLPPSRAGRVPVGAALGWLRRAHLRPRRRVAQRPLGPMDELGAARRAAAARGGAHRARGRAGDHGRVGRRTGRDGSPAGRRHRSEHGRGVLSVGAGQPRDDPAVA